MSDNSVMHVPDANAISARDWIVGEAKALGFELCGVVHGGQFPELTRTEGWLRKGFAGEMKYLSDARRRDPHGATGGLRSVIVCALHYNAGRARSIDVPAPAASETPRGWISRYAWGDDYHQVITAKLERLSAAMRERFGAASQCRIYADTGPVQERIFAKYAGLGWLGKNTLLLNQKIGSWFFLGVLLTNLDIAPSLAPEGLPPADMCGTCRKCLDACPTDAFPEPYVMDARRCISYLTIELRGSVPEEFRPALGNHVFGCDICQDVCPWNRKAPVTANESFEPRVASGPANGPRESLFNPRLEWLASMSEVEFREVFRGSPVKRAKWRGLVRNACLALGNATLEPGSEDHRRVQNLLVDLSQSPEPLIAESAQWALSRIQEKARNLEPG